MQAQHVDNLVSRRHAARRPGPAAAAGAPAPRWRRSRSPPNARATATIRSTRARSTSPCWTAARPRSSRCATPSTRSPAPGSPTSSTRRPGDLLKEVPSTEYHHQVAKLAALRHRRSVDALGLSRSAIGFSDSSRGVSRGVRSRAQRTEGSPCPPPTSAIRGVIDRRRLLGRNRRRSHRSVGPRPPGHRRRPRPPRRRQRRRPPPQRRRQDPVAAARRMLYSVRDLVANDPALYPTLPAGYRQVFEALATLGFAGIEFFSFSGAPSFAQHANAEGGATSRPRRSGPGWTSSACARGATTTARSSRPRPSSA